MNAFTRTPRRKPRHRAPKRYGVRAALASAGAILAGVLVAVAGTSGSYALWNQAAPIADATISSAAFGVTVKYGSGVAGSTAAIPTAGWAGMLPGDFVGQEITVANTGSIPANMTVKLNAAVPYEIRVAAGTCPATVLTTAALTTTAVSYGALPAGMSTPACVQVLLPAGAAAGVQGTSSAFTITIAGAQ